MIRRALLELLDLLGALRPLLGPAACRFEPSCSRYAREALELHAPPRAILLVAGRLLRCHPFNPGGRDPVPARA